MWIILTIRSMLGTMIITVMGTLVEMAYSNRREEVRIVRINMDNNNNHKPALKAKTNSIITVKVK